MLMVNGAAVPAPSALKVTMFDVGSTNTRNAAGGAVIDRMGTKRRLELKWAKMEGDALCALLSQVGSGFFQVRYPDPQDGETRAAECFCGDRIAGVLRMIDGAPVWIGVEMVWTER